MMQNARKRRKGRLLKAAIMMLTILMTTTNCDNDIDVGPPDIEPSTTLSEPSQIDYTSSDDDPDILAILDQQMVETSEKSVSAKSVKYKKTYIDLKKIVKVKNDEDIINYTMKLFTEQYQETPNVFYNVVINEKNGKIITDSKTFFSFVMAHCFSTFACYRRLLSVYGGFVMMEQIYDLKCWM